MKTKITRQFLAEQCRTKARQPSLTVPLILIGVFLLLCFIFVPFPFSLIPVVIVALIAFMIYRKWQDMMKDPLDPYNAYLRLQTVTDKTVRDYHDEGQWISRDYLLIFDHNDSVAVQEALYHATEAGHMFYVAYFSENDKPFRCYDADWFEPDIGMLR